MRDLYAGTNVFELKGNRDFLINKLRGNNRVKLNKFIANTNTKTNPNNRSYDGLIVFYAPWCPHCNNPEFMNVIKNMAKMLHPNGGRVCAYNATDERNEDVAKYIGINSFPTIKYFDKKGKMTDYNQSRDIKSLLKEYIQRRKKYNK